MPDLPPGSIPNHLTHVWYYNRPTIVVMKLVLHPSVFSLQLSAMYSLLSFLLLSSFGLAADLNEQPGCPTSSCGEIPISYPFRLKGDPAGCGWQQLELVCNANKTILDWNSGKYHVTDISYSDYTFHVVDASVARGNCSLPFGFQWPSGVGIFANTSWAGYVNCTRMIKNSMYWPVHCLSGNNTFVYVIILDFPAVRYVEPFCGYLAGVPIPYAPAKNSSSEVFKLLQKGFTLVFETSSGWSKSRVVHQCLGEAKR